MRINCLSCGHKIELDEAYDDFEGPIRCLCRALLEIKAEAGKLKRISLKEGQRRPAARPRGLESPSLS